MRKRYIDYLRVISMLAVVMIHICTTAMTDFNDGIGTYKGALFVSVTNLLHFAVPVFFMISGALLLNPKKEMTLGKLLKKYILKYACVILIFCWAFALIEIVFDKHDIQLAYFLQSFLNMLQGKTWAHMWYMYALLGVMMILPILRWTAKKAEGRDIIYLIVVFGIFLSILPFLEKIVDFNIGIQFPIISVYLFHMLLGYWIDTGVIHWSNKTSGIIIACCCVLLAIASYFDVIWNVEASFIGDYSSPIMIIYAMSLFMLLKNMAHQGEEKTNCAIQTSKKRLLDVLSECSFGVYIIHMFWINLAYKLFRLNPFVPNVFVMMIAVWLIVVLLSVISTIIMRKIPLIKRML